MANGKKASRKSVIPADETPNQAFVRLAKARLAKVCEALDVLGKMARGYEYTPQQVTNIVTILETRVKGVKVLFSDGGRTASNIEI